MHLQFQYKIIFHTFWLEEKWKSKMSGNLDPRQWVNHFMITCPVTSPWNLFTYLTYLSSYQIYVPPGWLPICVISLPNWFFLLLTIQLPTYRTNLIPTYLAISLLSYLHTLHTVHTNKYLRTDDSTYEPKISTYLWTHLIRLPNSANLELLHFFLSTYLLYIALHTYCYEIQTT